MNIKTKTVGAISVICMVILLIINFALENKIDAIYQENTILHSELKKIYLSDQDFFDNMAIGSLILRDYQKNKQELQEKVFAHTGKPFLIYRYADNICHTCIGADLGLLDSLQKEIGRKNIFILPALKDDRNNRISLRSTLSKFEYKNIPRELLILPGDSGQDQRRYFAVINENGDMEMVFSPQYNSPEKIKAYFRIVKQRFNDHSMRKTSITK